MSEFLTELEEDIREEKVLALWHKYGHFLIGLSVVIVLATVGYTLWTYFQKKSQLNQYASFSEGVSLFYQGKKEEARLVFEALGKKKDGYGKLAQLYEATLLSDPVAFYEKIAQENHENPSLSSLCKLFVATHSLKKTSLETMLEPLSAPQNAWAPLALEFLGFSALQRGDMETAINYYMKALQEPYLTPAEKTRMGMAIAQLDVPANSLLRGRRKK